MLECALGRLKSRWRILDVDLNLAEIQYDFVQEQMEREHLAQSCSYHDKFDKLYSYNTSRGKLVREAIADYLYDKYNLK